VRPFILVFVFCVILTGCEPGLSSFDRNVDGLIRKQCNFENPCQVKLADTTDFEWDEMYVFRPGITDGEAELLVPAAKGIKGEFNRKIAFLSNGKLTRLDEAPSIIEGEHTPPGMLFFDTDEEGNHDCLRYPRDAVFVVRQEKSIRGYVNILKCSNCEQSPVFAEFGTAITRMALKCKDATPRK
jgi:hypothetical protein